MKRLLPLLHLLFIAIAAQGFCSPHPQQKVEQARLNKALFKAIAEYDMFAVKDLLSKGVNVNACTKNGWSLLMEAVYRNRLDIVELLLKSGADVNHRRRNGDTALVVATGFPYLKVECIKTLVANGADVNVRTRYRDDTLLMLVLDRSVEDKQKEVSTLRFFLDKGVDPGAKNRDGKTALMYAVEHGSFEKVNLLLERGVSVNDRDRDGCTALLYLEHAWNGEVCQRLLAKGAEVNVCNRKGVTPLMIASEGRDSSAEIVSLLQSGAKINARDVSGRTALFYAMAGSDDPRAAILLAAGADVHICAKDGTSLLMVAARSGKANKVRFLLEKGLDANARNRQGRTVLMSLGGDVFTITAILEMLLKHGADIHAKDSRGRTLLFAAAEDRKKYGDVSRLAKLVDAVDVLTKNGVDINERDKEGESILILASMMKESRSMGGDYLAFANLLKQGADATARNKKGYSALTWRAFEGDEESIKLLQEKGAEPDLLEAIMLGDKETALKTLVSERHLERSGPYNQTALMMAVEKGYPGIVHALLERGANVNAKDALHATSLHLATGFGPASFGREWSQENMDSSRLEIVRDLLAHGANVNALSKAHRPGWADSAPGYSAMTPLECAMSRDVSEIARILIEHGASVRGRVGERVLEWAEAKGFSEVAALLKKRGVKPKTSRIEENGL